MIAPNADDRWWMKINSPDIGSRSEIETYYQSRPKIYQCERCKYFIPTYYKCRTCEGSFCQPCVYYAHFNGEHVPEKCRAVKIEGVEL